ncbi:DUF4181 domain-containing protein [Bacillus ndiopicus]|uniref:DUF4181 domain-containing protein n=1 Tax=Bacillus ndiopicus TaxID=1347368 RepID=UPI0005A95749|nr:DUF4181 domain-containing protein [Bacillus ndiopicus]
MIIIVFIAGFVIAGILDLRLRKKFNVKKNEKFMDQYVNKAHLVFEILLSAFFIVNIAVKGFSGKYLYFLLFLFFALVFAIRVALEYIFMKEQRKFIIALAYMVVCLACAITIILFL